ncbi:MAG TPA: signal peptidase II [Rhizomicrobium sp.]
MGVRDWGLVAASLALFLDQASKIFLLYGLGLRREGHVIPLFPHFNLDMHWNAGISFGIFQSKGPLGTAILVVFSLAAVAGLARWLWGAAHLGLAVGLGLIMGGAIGNLIDRMVYGQVADFFHFYAMGYDWYVFNIADCAITLGVAALVYDAFFRPQARNSANGQAGAGK